MKRRPVAAPEDYPLAADYAYAMLRGEIIEGELLPGSRLREAEVASWLGISRTPVRQALSRLEVEGLLTLLPRGGLSVARLDGPALSELYDMREALEATAVALAARNASVKEIAGLQKMIEEASAQRMETADFAAHNKDLHRAIYRAAHNRFLAKSMQSLHDAMALLGPVTLATRARRQQAHAEHVAIVGAIARHDPEAAAEAVRDHIRNAYRVRAAQFASSGGAAAAAET